MNNFLIYSYYRFVNVRNKKEIKIKIENFIKGKKLRGTILLANEGINGSISGQKKDLDKLLRFIKNTLNIRKVSLKINEVSFLPFNRLKEIWQGDKVSMYRKKHDELKYHEIEACKNCNAHTFQKDKLWAKLH